MSGQLALEEGAPPAPSAWEWARAKWPGKVVIRVINIPTRKQAFAALEAEAGFLVDGSTHYIGAPAGSLSPNDEAELVAECDRNWQDPASCPSA